MLENEDPGTEVLGASVATWQKKKSASQMQDLIKTFTTDKTPGSTAFEGVDSTKPETPIPLPVDIKIEKMSRDGTLSVKFNQKMRVPGFLTKTDSKGRRLVELSEIDVARDVIDVQFVSRNDDETSKKDFFLDLKDWTSDKIELQVNFTDPLSVSYGNQQDSIITKIKNAELFQPEDGRAQPLSKEKMTSVATVPA